MEKQLLIFLFFYKIGQNIAQNFVENIRDKILIYFTHFLKEKICRRNDFL